jgi:hypothetical protein
MFVAEYVSSRNVLLSVAICNGIFQYAGFARLEQERA